MTIYIGTAGRVMDDSGIIAGIKTWTLDTGTSELEASHFGSTWRLTGSGIKEWSGSFKGNYDDSDLGQTRLWSTFLSGAFINLYLNMAFPVPSFNGYARITGHSPSQVHDALGSGTWFFKGTGALVKS